MPDLKLITGGAGTGSGNWLLDLEEGTQFYVCDKLERANFYLLRLQMLRKEQELVALWAFPTDVEDLEGKPFGVVHPGRFINRFDLVKIIAVPSKEQEQEG